MTLADIHNYLNSRDLVDEYMSWNPENDYERGETYLTFKLKKGSYVYYTLKVTKSRVIDNTADESQILREDITSHSQRTGKSKKSMAWDQFLSLIEKVQQHSQQAA